MVVLQQGPSSVEVNRDTLRQATREFAVEIVRVHGKPALFSATGVRFRFRSSASIVWASHGSIAKQNDSTTARTGPPRPPPVAAAGASSNEPCLKITEPQFPTSMIACMPSSFRSVHPMSAA